MYGSTFPEIYPASVVLLRKLPAVFRRALWATLAVPARRLDARIPSLWIAIGHPLYFAGLVVVNILLAVLAFAACDFRVQHNELHPADQFFTASSSVSVDSSITFKIDSNNPVCSFNTLSGVMSANDPFDPLIDQLTR